MPPSAGEQHLLRALRGPLARTRGALARVTGLTLFPVHPDVERYLESLGVPPADPIRAEMEALADREGFPIVGPLVGRFLEMMARSVGAKRIFELGSGFGYSAWWFARGLSPGGSLVATDGDPENLRRARDLLGRAGLLERVTLREGRAQDLLRDTPGTFDVCYNDVDKDQYPEAWQVARDRIRPGGLYLADNTLWFGRVVRSRRPGALTVAIREHNRLVFADPAFDAWIHPIRDGILVARRRDDR